MLTSTYILLFLDTSKVVEVGYGAELVEGDIPLWKRCRVVVVALCEGWILEFDIAPELRMVAVLNWYGSRALKHVIDVKTVSRCVF
jgi:hypothetical protein